MSSLQKTKSGFRIQFRVDGKLRQISLRAVGKRQAVQIQRNVDHLVSQRRLNLPPEEWCLAWLEGCDEEWRASLRALGLLPQETVADADIPASDWLEDWLYSRRRLAVSTQHNDVQFKTSFVACFGLKKVADFTFADGDDFRDFCLRSQELAENTTRKRCGQGSTFFRWLIKRQVASLNPFEDVPKAVGSAIHTKQHISAEVIQRVIREAPDAEWKALIALGRWGGLRIPSEAFALEWGHINWDSNRFVVNSSKTAHQNKPQRTVPLFPEILPYLLDLSESQPDGTQGLFPRLSQLSGNVGVPFRKMIQRAGVKPWPKIWNSLRSTRETELAAEYPIHVVCEWIGNSPAVATRHYLKATDADFDKASSADILPTSSAAKQN